MISGSAICRLRWTESTSDCVPCLVFESVFHFSIRSLARSICVCCATCSNCESMRFSSLTDAYGTGVVAAAGAGATWAVAVAIRNGNTQCQPQIEQSFMRLLDLSIPIFVVFVKLYEPEFRRLARSV